MQQHLKIILLTTKIKSIMESLKCFYCKSAKVELFMVDLEDNEDCLYIINEEPISKESKWRKLTYKYWDTEEAHEKFLELVTFWCR